MSGTPPEAAGAVDLPFDLDSAFSTIMDTLVPDADGAQAGQGSAPAAPAAGAAGQPAALVEGAGAAAPAAAQPPAGGAGQQPVPPAGAAPAAGAEPAGADGSAPGAGTVAFADVQAEFGKLSTAIETQTLEIHQKAALAEVQKDPGLGRYFDAVQKHPRLLVGTEVPAIGKEGTEVLKDTQDARDWQEAVKQALTEEIRSRTQTSMEADSGVLSTIHEAIELFQNNGDLVPGTAEFDKELADEFVKLAKPYELRVEGKLHGYSIPVQPLVTQLRTQLVAGRAAKAAAAAPAPAGAPAAPAPAPAAAPAAPAAAGPQAGIPSKAGAGSEAEDFTALFGTIGLPTLRI